MLKLLKWNSINYIRKYYWLYLSLATVFIITAVVPEDIHIISSIVDGIASIFSILFYGYSFVISCTGLINWLREDSSQLELSQSARPWKILLSKLILSFSVNISGLLLTELLWSLIKRFGMSNITLYNGFSGFVMYLTCVLMFLVFVMFSYIAAKSSNLTRNKAMFITVLLTILTPLFLIGVASIAFVSIGAWDISLASHSDISVLSNGKFQWFEMACGILGAAMAILAGFMSSCTLFSHRFERY